jgi:hypothetical protein
MRLQHLLTGKQALLFLHQPTGQSLELAQPGRTPAIRPDFVPWRNASCFYDDKCPLSDHSRRLHLISLLSTAALPATFWIEQSSVHRLFGSTFDSLPTTHQRAPIKQTDEMARTTLVPPRPRSQRRSFLVDGIEAAPDEGL